MIEVKSKIKPGAIIVSIFLFLFACNSKQQKEGNKQYANVYQSLNGTWKGAFWVLQNKNGQPKDNAQPRNISIETLKSLPFDTIQKIKVEQTYKSITPYKQEAWIKDTYRNNGKVKTVESHGFNLVENGELKCVIEKPTETVRHRGTLISEHTIIWERKLKDPLKIEFFKESVMDTTYTIVGWGYYGNDDTTKAPKTWFFGRYYRQ